jgi:hypothetical protein
MADDANAGIRDEHLEREGALEKLNSVHNNPVKRGRVAQPRDWPWFRRGEEVLLPGG